MTDQGLLEEEQNQKKVFTQEEQLEEKAEALAKNRAETRHYAKIGLTIFITFVCCILFFFSILRYQGFASVWSKVMSAAQPIIMGLVIAYLLNPVMLFAEKKVYTFVAPRMEEKKARKLSRALGVTFAILFLIGIIAFLIAALVPSTVSSIITLTDTLPKNLQNVSTWIDTYLSNNEQMADSLNNVISQVTEYVQSFINDTLKPQAQTYLAQITTGVISIVKAIVNFLIGIFVAVYVMTIQETLTGQSKKILYTVFKPKRANTIIEVVRKSSDIFGGFITGKLIDSLIIGIIAYIGCLILKMPDSVLVAVIIGVTNVIPFFGPFIGAIPSLLLVVIQSPIHALYLLIFIIVLQQVDGNIIGPKILGNSTGLSSFWVMFSILVFGGMFGFMGMLLGVPCFAVIYYIVQRLVHYGLRKRGLPTETKQYVHVTRVDEKNGDLIYEEKAPKADKSEKAEEAPFSAPPGDTLHKELLRAQQKRQNKKEKKQNKK